MSIIVGTHYSLECFYGLPRQPCNVKNICVYLKDNILHIGDSIEQFGISVTCADSVAPSPLENYKANGFLSNNVNACWASIGPPVKHH